MVSAMNGVLPMAAPLARMLPVVDRELRLAARGPAAYRWRTSVAAIGLAVTGLLTLTLSSRAVAPEIQGRTLFYTLVFVSALYAFVAGVSVTADSVSREKRDGTLGLLFLTDLRGRHIILGKLVANSLNTSYGLIGLLPLLAIPVLMGGVSVADGVLATLSVVNLMFVSLNVGILVSTVSWDERRATFAGLVAGLALMVGPLLLGGLGVYYGRGSASAWFLSSWSPLFSMLAALQGQGGGGAMNLLLLLPSHALGWLALMVAGRLAEGSWQGGKGHAARRTLDERVFNPADAGVRARMRRRLLDVHPLVWLLERHPAKRFYADGLVLAVLAIWMWGFRTYGTDMFGGPTWFLIVPLAFVVHLILASWVVSEASMRLVEDRRTGALELLLCSGLTDRDIIRGHRLALRRLFLRPVLLLMAVEVLVAFYGFGQEDDEASRNGRWMLLALAAAVFLDTHALSWIALRLAVSLPNVNRIGILAMAITPVGPLVLTALTTTILTWWGSVPMRFGLTLGIWMGWVLLVGLGVGQGWCRRVVLSRFREEAIRMQPRAAVTGS